MPSTKSPLQHHCCLSGHRLHSIGRAVQSGASGFANAGNVKLDLLNERIDIGIFQLIAQPVVELEFQWPAVFLAPSVEADKMGFANARRSAKGRLGAHADGGCEFL